MNGINRVTIVGNLGANPELKIGKTGKPFCHMSVATHFSKPNGEGVREPVTTWHRITAFGKTAERCHTYLERGSTVAIEGYLSKFTKEKEDGTKTYGIDIIAQQVEFIGGRRESRLPSISDDSSGAAAAAAAP